MLLLDEPLGALDLKLRQEMQVFLKSLQRELGMTFLYVTHDQEEALTMSDHVAVFNEGRIEQIGSPDEVYEHPATEFVAGFVGTSNILERDGRASPSGPSGSSSTGDAAKPGRSRDVVFVGAFTRYPRRHRRRRAAHGRPAERRLGSRAAARASTSAGATRTRTRSPTPIRLSSRRSDDEAHVGAARDPRGRGSRSRRQA